MDDNQVPGETLDDEVPLHDIKFKILKWVVGFHEWFTCTYLREV